MGYQETLGLYAKNVDKIIQTIWKPIYEVINVTLFEETNIFHNNFRRMIKIQNKPQFLPFYVKKSWQEWLWNQGYMHKWS